MILINKWALKFKLRCPSKPFIHWCLMAFTKKLNIWLWSLIIWVRVAMKRAIIGDWDKFIDNQREKHNQNLSVDCLLILLRLSKCLSRYHLSLTLSNVILFTQGGVKNDFLLLEESCDSLVDHTDVKVVPEPNSVGSYHQWNASV